MFLENSNPSILKVWLNTASKLINVKIEPLENLFYEKVVFNIFWGTILIMLVLVVVQVFSFT